MTTLNGGHGSDRLTQEQTRQKQPDQRQVKKKVHTKTSRHTVRKRGNVDILYSTQEGREKG